MMKTKNKKVELEPVKNLQYYKTLFKIGNYPNCYKGFKYAEDVVSKKITACRYIIAACERFLRDLENTEANFYFNPDIAERYLKLVQKFEHTEGHWDTKNVVYEPWQCWSWMNIMGFINKTTGFRRFRVAHIEVGRGNGKSLAASSCGLYFLALDNSNGNHVATVATKREQARIVLDSARTMAKRNTGFLNKTGVRVMAHEIIHPKSSSKMRALSADHSSLDGLKDALAICDELHAMDKDVFEVISSGMSKRKDSLLLCITTAGSNVQSIGYSQSTFAKKVATGEVDDDSFFSAIYTLDAGDDWSDENVWIKSNPNLGVSVDIDSLRSKVAKALHTPADVANIRIKHFNEWIAEANAFFDTNLWDKCADPTLDIKNFKGKSSRVGFDLASHIDLTSMGIVFREGDTYTIFDKSYIPEETVNNSKNTLYDDCIAKGYLNKTKGAAINYEHIQKEAIDFSKEVCILEGFYDPWNAVETAQRLSPHFEMVKIPMTVANLSEPMKKLDSLIRTGKVRHNGSPLLKWCLGNVVAKEDHNGNVFPRKTHERLKIDPIVAILMALAGWIQDEDGESIYETRGIRTL